MIVFLALAPDIGEPSEVVPDLSTLNAGLSWVLSNVDLEAAITLHKRTQATQFKYDLHLKNTTKTCQKYALEQVFISVNLKATLRISESLK